MKYVSIDLETTGLDPEQCQVLEFGAVIETGSGDVEELPSFSRVIYRKQIVGEAYALGLNTDLIRMIAVEGAEREKASWGEEKEPPVTAFCMEHSLGGEFATWLQVYGFTRRRGKIEITVAGKNYGMFDARFLERIESWIQHVRVRHRVIDVGTLYATAEDETLPGLGTCLERAGMVGIVAHRAVDDARAVIRLLRARGWHA